jgi:hypothetical protein
MHSITQGDAEGLNQGLATMIEAADGFPRMLETAKDEFGAVYERSVEVK